MGFITSEPEAGAQDEHRVEIELRVEGAPYVLGLAESVLLAVEQKIADRNALSFSAATMSSVWFGGTTRSSAPWKKITGAERRSTWLIGERSA